MPIAASDAPGRSRSSSARNGLLAMPRDMIKVVRLVWRSSPRLTCAFFGLTAVVALLPPAIAWVGKGIIDAVVAGRRQDTIHWILVECVIVVLLASARQLLNLARTMLDSRLGIDVHLLLLQRANSMELRHFEDSNFYDQLERARREASSRPIAVVTRMFDLLENGMRLLGYASLLLAFGPLAVLGLLLAALPATIAEARYSRAEFKVRNARSTDWRRLHYLEHTLTTEWHAKEIRLFGLGPLLLDRYRQQAERLHQERVRMATRRSIVTHALSLLATAALYAAYGVIGLMAVAGSISVGTLTMYLASLHNVQQCFQAILQGISRIYEHNLYMSNLFNFLERPLSDDEPLPQTADAPAPAHDGGSTATRAASGADERGLRLEHVSFRYPDKAQWILQDLCLHIPHGQRVALVGHNGAGKTTLVKLITGLYRPSAGRVLLDGKDLRDYDQTELRARFGVIFQDYNRYHLSLQENVGVGSIERLADRERVTAAMVEGGAHNLLTILEQGLDTQLGTRFTRGVELSGGQWQSVALARGFMRTHADTLVLDEPSAALDAEAEHRVFERFQTLSRGRTTIIVSHRFPTVRLAERILVLENGCIAEDGTHSELLALDGSYARFFRLQAAGYD